MDSWKSNEQIKKERLVKEKQEEEKRTTERIAAEKKQKEKEEKIKSIKESTDPSMDEMGVYEFTFSYRVHMHMGKSEKQEIRNVTRRQALLLDILIDERKEEKRGRTDFFEDEIKELDELLVKVGHQPTIDKVEAEKRKIEEDRIRREKENEKKSKKIYFSSIKKAIDKMLGKGGR